jgi:hypothetical protein
MRRFSQFGLLFVTFFSILFALTLPFPFALIPSIGISISKLLQPLIGWFLGQFTDTNHLPTAFAIESDSIGLYYQTCFILILACVLALILVFRIKTIQKPKIYGYLNLFSSYILALFLLKYGCDKIFKVQFFFPEPNTLYTPLGFLSKDILFWSTMGASYSYSLFLGILEIIPALLLLHRKTRFLGAVIAFGVLLHVQLINYSFDISVKIVSAYLLLQSIICIVPFVKPLIDFFILKKQTLKYPDFISLAIFQSKHYRVLKSFLVSLMICESCFFFIENKIFNDDLVPRPKMHGAYEVLSDRLNIGHKRANQSEHFGNIEDIKRVFFHRRGYLIFQYKTEKFLDFPGYYDEKKHQFVIALAENSMCIQSDYDASKKKYIFHWKEIDKKTGISCNYQLTTQKIDLSKLPLALPLFHWIVE